MLRFVVLLAILAVQQTSPSIVIVHNLVPSPGWLGTRPSEPPRWEAFRVYASGEIGPIGFNLRQEGLLSTIPGNGSSTPLPSPDGEHIAYIQERNLWLWNARDKSTRQLTTIGSEPNEQYRGVLLRVTDWSTDSTEILFYIADEFAGAGARVRKPIQYGFHIYNIAADRTRTIAIPGTTIDDRPFATVYDWLESGEFLITDRTGLVAIYDPRTTTSNTIDARRNGFGLGQVDRSTRAPFVVGRRMGYTLLTDGTSRIERIDVRTGKAMVMSPEGTTAEYQAPSISPSGTFITYYRLRPIHPPEGASKLEVDLVLDGRVVFTFTSPNVPLAYVRWIDDNTAVIIDKDRVIVMDAPTGSIVGDLKLPNQ